MAKPTKLSSFCSLLMAILFAYSASVQLNDSDWYFWFPLYACACVVNLESWGSSTGAIRIKHLAKGAICLGVFLFVKVVAEDVSTGIAGFWSLDLTERVVREKTGSALVITSMILQLLQSPEPTYSQRRKKDNLGKYGMVILVCFGYGLPCYFFVIQEGEMKF